MEKQTIKKNKGVICSDSARSFADIQSGIAKLSGKWTLMILWNLWERPLRFGELKKRFPTVTQQMLTSTLRELERNRLVIREVFAEVPPKVIYSLSVSGIALAPIFESIVNWSVASASKSINDTAEAAKGDSNKLS